MREAVVPGFTLRESQDSVTLAWESADGTPLRARFKRRGEALYLLAVETRTRPRTRLDAGAEAIPARLRGWEVHVDPDDAPEDVTGADAEEVEESGVR